jgi:ABC-type anion transport system duplicated permease subunit
MGKIKLRFLFSLFVLIAFFGPFIAIIGIENNRRNAKISASQDQLSLAQAEATRARYQYYLEANAQKKNLAQAMAESKAQYEQLLKEQPTRIKEKQTTVSQNIIRPVVTQKVVQQKAATSSTSAKVSVASSKPKATTTTKAS